jgi:16S rRNA processing protein RimM
MERLSVARIRGPVGLRGYLKITSYSGEYEHLRDLREVILVRGTDRREAFIEDIVVTDEGANVRFRGAENPESAQAFVDWEIEVGRDRACPLAEGEYYISDLCGCTAVYQGVKVGIIRSVSSTGASDLLEIETVSGGRSYVPFVEAFVGAVDIAARSVEILDRGLVE